jgi:hypothetical protein
MYVETHYLDGPRPAKRLQVQREVSPADVGVLIAGTIPNPADQEAMGLGPPPAEGPKSPWSDEAFRGRVAEARAARAERHQRNGAAHVAGAG